MLSDDLARSLVAGFDILDAMLNEVLNGQVSNELGDEQTNLLKQIEDLSVKCAGEATSEQRLLDEVLKLADEMERADSSHTDDWSARLRTLVRNFQTEDKPGEDSSGDTKVPDPADWANATFHCGSEDITDRVQELIAIFILTKNQQYEESHGAAFLATLNNSIQWAEKAQQPKLADCLRAAEKDFKTIFDSPLDVDSYLLGIIWEILWPELERCTSKPVSSAEQR